MTLAWVPACDGFALRRVPRRRDDGVEKSRATEVGSLQPAILRLQPAILRLSASIKSEAKSLELPTTAYEIRNEGPEIADVRNISYAMERDVHVERGDETWDYLELQRGGIVPGDMKARLHKRVIVTQCSKKYGWPAIRVGLPGFMLVTEQAKQIIEMLEPSVHEFFRLDVHDMTGNMGHSLFLLNCRNRIHAVIVNRSADVYVRQDPPEFVNGKHVTFDRSLHGGGCRASWFWMQRV
jgi:hypothetical protein